LSDQFSSTMWLCSITRDLSASGCDAPHILPRDRSQCTMRRTGKVWQATVHRRMEGGTRVLTVGGRKGVLEYSHWAGGRGNRVLTVGGRKGRATCKMQRHAYATESRQRTYCGSWQHAPESIALHCLPIRNASICSEIDSVTIPTTSAKTSMPPAPATRQTRNCRMWQGASPVPVQMWQR
jgi:hypothetical protein